MNKTIDLNKIRNAVAASDLLVKELAAKIGTTPNTLSSFLNGNRRLGSSAQILLLHVLKLKPKDVFTETNKVG